MLRRERLVFETVFAKLEKDLGVKRQSIARLVESVSGVYDRRDQAIEQLRLLQLASENSTKGHFNQDLDGIQVEDLPAEAPSGKLKETGTSL